MVTTHCLCAFWPGRWCNACALARCADRIDSEVVVVANLRHELRLEHIAVATVKLGTASVPTAVILKQ